MSVKVTKDGRTIRTGKDYTQFRVQLWVEQRGICVECKMNTNPNAPIFYDCSFHVAHRGSRGIGSGIRDDVLGPKRGQVEGGKCGRCHRKEHNQ